MQYSSEEEEVDLQTALTGYQTKQRKLLEPVDHGKIEYEPFRKNFYVEVPELAKMTQEGKDKYNQNTLVTIEEKKDGFWCVEKQQILLEYKEHLEQLGIQKHWISQNPITYNFISLYMRLSVKNLPEYFPPASCIYV